jgi:hypothetical protein
MIAAAIAAASVEAFAPPKFAVQKNNVYDSFSRRQVRLFVEDKEGAATEAAFVPLTDAETEDDEKEEDEEEVLKKVESLGRGAAKVGHNITCAEMYRRFNHTHTHTHLLSPHRVG